jgi:hypothetical protein
MERLNFINRVQRWASDWDLRGGRMRLQPGLWVVMDELRQPDLREVKIQRTLTAHHR